MFGHSFPQPDDASDDDGQLGSGSDTSSKENARPSSSAIITDSPSEQGVVSPTATEAKSIRHLERSEALKQDLSSSNPESHLEVPQKKKRQLSTRSHGAHSFVTAQETQIHDQPSPSADDNPKSEPKHLSTTPSTEEISTPDGDDVARFSTASSPLRPDSFNGRISRPVDGTTSTSSLLPHGKDYADTPTSTNALSSGQPVEPTTDQPKLQDLAPEEYLHPSQTDVVESRPKKSPSAGLVRFNISDELADGETHMKAKYASISHRGSLKQFRRAKLNPGEIVKVEKMLVRVDYTLHELPTEYDENDSLKSESRVIEKWREFVVVCRKGIEDQAEFLLQMYKSRVIPATEQPQVQKRSAHSIPLSRKSTKLNLYSSLDKTIVIWVPWKKGTRIYILRPQSSASSVEWYTFLRDVLGRQRPDTLQINVPDLDVTLQLENPFEDVERARHAARAGDEDMTALIKTMAVERAVAGNIVKRCMTMLEDSPEWSHVLESWLKHERMGLAWKRYDRLEWIHGANEQKMYGTLAMQKTHDLELRPKHHYPTHVRTMEEPTPVEGFLIRLTSQKGRDQRFGKKFSKRLYFSTHNQFLCYCKPGKAIPPPPPKFQADHSGNPTTKDRGKIPLIYALNPYPIDDRAHLSWLKRTTPAQKQSYDQNAYEEAERKVNTLLQAEGYINLCHVARVQHAQRQKSSTDHQPLNGGSRTDNNETTNDTSGELNDTKNADTDRTFELLLHNGLVVRLQAYDQVTKKEWMARLDRIAEYWKLRIADDMILYKVIRQTNLDRLNIDEEMESVIGQNAEKWEVSRSVASPQLFNMCGISCCRSITASEASHLELNSSNKTLDVWSFISQTAPPFHISTLQRHPQPRATFDFPKYSPQVHGKSNPTHPSRARASSRLEGLLHLQWPRHRRRSSIPKSNL